MYDLRMCKHPLDDSRLQRLNMVPAMRATHMQNVLFIYGTYDVCGHGLSDLLNSQSEYDHNQGS